MPQKAVGMRWTKFASVQGFPEKLGGWTVKTFNAYEGSARSLFTWAAIDGAKLTAVGTNEKIYINTGTRSTI
jgi:hypothetical protein